MTSQAPFFVDLEVIILNKNGIWLSGGVEITHEPTRKLFARSLKKDAEGYFLSVGRETKRIQVEDTAYFVHRLHGDPTIGYRVELSDETKEPLKPETLKYRPGRLSCQLGSGEEAKFLHVPYFEILKNLQEDNESYFLEFGDSQNKKRITLAPKKAA